MIKFDHVVLNLEIDLCKELMKNIGQRILRGYQSVSIYFAVLMELWKTRINWKSELGLVKFQVQMRSVLGFTLEDMRKTL